MTLAYLTSDVLGPKVKTLNEHHWCTDEVPSSGSSTRLFNVPLTWILRPVKYDESPASRLSITPGKPNHTFLSILLTLQSDNIPERSIFCNSAGIQLKKHYPPHKVTISKGNVYSSLWVDISSKYSLPFS